MNLIKIQKLKVKHHQAQEKLQNNKINKYQIHICQNNIRV